MLPCRSSRVYRVRVTDRAGAPEMLRAVTEDRAMSQEGRVGSGVARGEERDGVVVWRVDAPGSQCRQRVLEDLQSIGLSWEEEGGWIVVRPKDKDEDDR